MEYSECSICVEPSGIIILRISHCPHRHTVKCGLDKLCSARHETLPTSSHVYYCCYYSYYCAYHNNYYQQVHDIQLFKPRKSHICTTAPTTTTHAPTTTTLSNRCTTWNCTTSKWRCTSSTKSIGLTTPYTSLREHRRRVWRESHGAGYVYYWVSWRTPTVSETDEFISRWAFIVENGIIVVVYEVASS